MLLSFLLTFSVSKDLEFMVKVIKNLCLDSNLKRPPMTNCISLSFIWETMGYTSP